MPLELNSEIYRAVLACMPVGAYLVDRQRRIFFWNTSAERITGYLGQEVIGRFCHDNLLMHCDQNCTMLCAGGCPLSLTMHDGQPREASIFLRHKDGQRIPVCVRTVPIRDDYGAIAGSAEFFEKRSFRAAMRGRRLPVRDSRDGVTELPDRPAMLATLQEAVEAFAASQKVFGVLSIAIDDVDRLYRTDGRQGVNAVLYAVAQTLASGIRPDDLVGRSGRESFLALVDCPTAEALLSCAERMKGLVGLAGVPWWGDRISVTVSFGGTLVREADTVESLVGRASDALEAGKAAHSNSVLVL